ncbi:Alpha/beta hydrolase family protein [Gimesia panareensis]|uniref:Alpha/beta hydrolase family protein n=1 Tax=Gimesia panareensis TaxID=2527978 RepID=A0A518FXD0_9PLAN|nr:dienelactone hydrolase family protein [Gimesia panareensis]QDV21033.1 Alpha/beta hydrolase family protein [Gimesia panareensis]
MKLLRPGLSILFLCWITFLSAGFVSAADIIEPDPRLPETTPWDLKTLSQSPKFEWIDQTGPVHKLLYQGLEYKGKPTQVFAYYASPRTLGLSGNQPARYPGIVLIHGGGGTAFREWAELWAKQGYAAIAMDLAGSRPLEGKNPHKREHRERLEAGGPNQSHVEKFNAIKDDKSEHWCYHAPANAILAHSLIRTFPEVIKDKTGVTGISWGGYLTSIVAGLDNRFKAAAPVYGCGFLNNHSVFERSINQLPEEDAKRWMQLYDPGHYLRAVQMPIFFLNGTNDFHYWLSAYQRSYEAVPKSTPKNIRIEVKMRHSHPAGWEPKEIARFMDEYLKQGAPLAVVQKPVIAEGKITAELKQPVKLKSAVLQFTTDEGPNLERKWQAVPLTIEGTIITGPAPPENAVIWFINVTDEQDAMTSSPLSSTLLK